MSKTNFTTQQKSREGLTLAKVCRFLSLPFRPAHLNTYLAVDRFEDISIQRLIDDGIEGILLDTDGTLCPHLAKKFSESVVAHVRKMKEAGLKIAVYTNASEDRFQQFPGINIVTQVPAKPDRHGFQTAMVEFLHLRNPSRVCMIGDNYITDGGAVSAGMRFIYVRPIKGKESPFHSFTRYLAFLCARFHNRRKP